LLNENVVFAFRVYDCMLPALKSIVTLAVEFPLDLMVFQLWPAVIWKFDPVSDSRAPSYVKFDCATALVVEDPVDVRILFSAGDNIESKPGPWYPCAPSPDEVEPYPVGPCRPTKAPKSPVVRSFASQYITSRIGLIEFESILNPDGVLFVTVKVRMASDSMFTTYELVNEDGNTTS